MPVPISKFSCSACRIHRTSRLNRHTTGTQPTVDLVGTLRKPSIISQLNVFFNIFYINRLIILLTILEKILLFSVMMCVCVYACARV